jgi:nucleoside-diphosphate-sugar epimerase
MKTNILVTGCTGTVGSALLELLSSDNSYQVTAFDLKNKRSFNSLKRFKDKIQIVYGDICDKEAVLEVCRDKDCIIHLAALIPPKADQYPDLAHAINVQGTQNIIDAILEYGNSSFLLYSSSVSVYGDRLKTPNIQVSDLLSPSEGDHYGSTKVEAERRIQNQLRNWSIFRLTAIMGVENHKMGGIMFHMPLDTLMEIASPEDTAKAFAFAIEKRECLNQKIYNLSGGSSCRISYQEFLQRSFDAFGLGKLDFPPNAFAEKNFHCGYYTDGDQLNEILHFRNDTIETHFLKLRRSISPIQRNLTYIFRKSIKRKLLSLSEPYQGYLSNDKSIISHFFEKEKL